MRIYFLFCFFFSRDIKAIVIVRCSDFGGVFNRAAAFEIVSY